MFVISFNSKNIGRSIISLISIVFCIFAILIKKDIIKSTKKWLSKATLILAGILIIPYFSISGLNRDVKKIDWNDIVLNNIIPKPSSSYGRISTNSQDGLSIYMYKTSLNQYNKYVKKCKNNGFEIDTEQLSDSFLAYNDKGYKLKLSYYEKEKRMSIDLSTPKQLGTLEWPDSEYSRILPIPESKIGKIEKDDETGFIVYVGNMPKESFKNYINQCSNKGFKIDSSESEKTYTAKNSDGYKIFIEYQGNNLMKITVYEKEYKINLEINCFENLMFSKYDVKVYVDKYSYQGTLKHGTTETYTKDLKKGEHTINFENADDSSIKGELKINISGEDTIKIKINCTSTGINAIDDKSNPLTMIDTKGLDANTAKDKLSNIGFTNVTVKGDDGNNMLLEDNSKWEIISQNVEAGAQIGQNAEIILTCHKKDEQSNTPTENTSTSNEKTETTPATTTQTETTPTETNSDPYSDLTYQDDAEDVFRMRIEDSCPYGVKIHSITGYLAKTYEGNGVYFFKVKITVKNEYNAKRDAVAEGRVDAANGNNITYFIIY